MDTFGQILRNSSLWELYCALLFARHRWTRRLYLSASGIGPRCRLSSAAAAIYRRTGPAYSGLPSGKHCTRFSPVTTSFTPMSLSSARLLPWYLPSPCTDCHSIHNFTIPLHPWTHLGITLIKQIQKYFSTSINCFFFFLQNVFSLFIR